MGMLKTINQMLTKIFPRAERGLRKPLGGITEQLSQRNLWCLPSQWSGAELLRALFSVTVSPWRDIPQPFQAPVCHSTTTTVERLLLGQPGYSLSSYTMCTLIALPLFWFLLYPALLCHSLAKSKEVWRAPELHCWGSRQALTGGSGTCRAGTCKAVPPLAYPRAVLKGLMLSLVECPLWNPFKLLCSSVGCIQTKSCRAFHES